MKNLHATISLFLVYFLFAILLNSVGTVILQVINTYDVTKVQASILEAFKDLSIAIVAFGVASFLPRFGYKNSLMAGLAIVFFACISMPLLPSFATTKILFLCTGIAFALVKVSVYSMIGLVTNGKRQHASMLNSIEGFFMIGVLTGYWLFSHYIGAEMSSKYHWLNVYWVLAMASLIILIIVFLTTFDETGSSTKGNTIFADFTNMLKLFYKPLVFVFIISAYIFVLIEQGISTWLPTFNNEILMLPAAMSVQFAGILAASSAVGRLITSAVLLRISWYPVVNFCVLGVAFLIVLVLPLTQNIAHDPNVSWSTAPLAAFMFPLIGFFLAPIYPAINSVMLSSLPKSQHASMMGLLAIFSALGGTTGSIVIGYIFGKFNGQFAFYLTLIPIVTILVSLFFFKRSVDRVAELEGK